MSRKKILFVCSANTCRSAAAEAILAEYGRALYDVASAGLFASEGTQMQESVAEALARLFGHPVVASSFPAKRLNNEMMLLYDEIMAVSEGYAAMLSSAYPLQKEKIRAFPRGISDFSCLSAQALDEAIASLREQIFDLYGV